MGILIVWEYKLYIVLLQKQFFGTKYAIFCILPKILLILILVMFMIYMQHSIFIEIFLPSNYYVLVPHQIQPEKAIKLQRSYPKFNFTCLSWRCFQLTLIDNVLKLGNCFLLCDSIIISKINVRRIIKKILYHHFRDFFLKKVMLVTLEFEILQKNFLLTTQKFCWQIKKVIKIYFIILDTSKVQNICNFSN